ncbi:hypothetical protein BaRGS_00008919, partial [Batillaria attramentaria]
MTLLCPSELPDNPVIKGPREVMANTPSTWTCDVNGSSNNVSVLWTFVNGTRIGNGVVNLGSKYYMDPDKASYTSSKSVLNLSNTSSSLTLTFAIGTRPLNLSCVAEQIGTNEQITQASSVLVVVCYRPIVSGHRDYSVLVDAKVVIRCVVEPVVNSVTWYKDNYVIQPSRRFEGGTPDNPSLTIVRVQKGDAGQYVCGASNSLGSGKSGISYVSVVYTPIITYNKTSFRGIFGTDIVLPCSIDANPRVKAVAWVESKVEARDHSSKYTGGNVSTPALTIINLTSEDAGSYRCGAKNDVGDFESRFLRLRVM